MPTTTTILATPQEKENHSSQSMSYKTDNKLTQTSVAIDSQEDHHDDSSRDSQVELPYTEEKKPFWQRFRFRVDTTDHPPQIFNLTLYLSIFVFGLFGAARGIDEGTGMY